MIYEINQMIDYLDDFFKGGHKETIVGGIAGTQIEKIALDAALLANPEFSKILVINGCQDYIGLMKKPMQNVLYWGDLFIEEMVDPLIPIDPWKPKMFNPAAEYVKRINSKILSMYDIILIYNAHLMPTDMIQCISENFSGKLVYIVDPLEPGGGNLMWDLSMEDIPVVVDHLEKVSPMIALARSSVGFESRAVDYKVRGSLVETNKFNRRSIGKIDDKQYFTNDFELLEEVQNRQIESPFKKNQKVLVDSDLIDVMYENGIRKATLTRNTMLVIQSPNQDPLMKLRLYNSKIVYAADIRYKQNVPDLLRRRNEILVNPANILNTSMLPYHRYNHSVMILGYKMSKRQRYSLFKNSNNVTIVNRFK